MRLTAKFYHTCVRFLDSIAALLLVWIFYSAYINPYIPWDSWSYHLPIASYLWNIGGGEDGFIPTLFVQNIYAGYPLLGEWLQGFLWFVFNDIRATALINPLALAALCIVCKAWLNINFSYLLFALLAFPLISIHAVSTYKDLYVGCTVGIALAAAAHIYGSTKKEAAFVFACQSAIPWVVFIISAIIAANSKLHAWFFLVPYIFFLAFALSRRIQKNNQNLLRLASISVALVVLCSYTQINNWVKHSQPFYPYKIISPFHVQMTSAAGEPASGASSRTGMPVYAGDSFIYNPVYFLNSVFETDHIYRDMPLRISVDMFSGNPADQVRSGGLWSVYVTLQLSLLCFLLFHAANRHSESDKSFLIISFLLVTFIVMLTPRSNDLRYVFFWPISLVLCTGACLRSLPQKQQLLAACLVIGLFAVGQTLIKDRPLFSQGRTPSSSQEWRSTASPEIVGKLNDNTATCLEVAEVHMHLWFRYSAAVIGGTHRILSPKDFNLTCDNSAPNTWLVRR